MIYESEPGNDGFSLTTDNRYTTAAAYLKGLHHGDRPTELMPQDGKWLKSAKRFYISLSEKDQMIIDSYSDRKLSETLNLKQRNKRFHELVKLLVCQIENKSIKCIWLPPNQAEKGTEGNEHD